MATFRHNRMIKKVKNLKEKEIVDMPGGPYRRNDRYFDLLCHQPTGALIRCGEEIRNI